MQSIPIGALMLPLRLLYPFIISLAVVIVLYQFLTKTMLGIAIRGVALDELVLITAGCNTLRIKSIVFGLSLATASLAGGSLIAVQPLNPFCGRTFIGLAFAVGVIGGMGNVLGTLLASIILGIVGNLASVLFGPVWGLAISFIICILLLLVKPTGLFRR
jgi:branched-chain amino acid transport system permease protein